MYLLIFLWIFYSNKMCNNNEFERKKNLHILHRCAPDDSIRCDSLFFLFVFVAPLLSFSLSLLLSHLVHHFLGCTLIKALLHLLLAKCPWELQLMEFLNRFESKRYAQVSLFLSSLFCSQYLLRISIYICMRWLSLNGIPNHYTPFIEHSSFKKSVIQFWCEEKKMMWNESTR